MSGRFQREVAAAHERLASVFEPTPLQLNQHLSDLHGARIHLQREDLTPVRSYKIRGAYAFLTDEIARNASAKLFVCASAGNHAQGFAHAVRNFRRKGVIYMPVTTPQQKIMKTASFGSPNVEIRLEGDTFDAANAAAHAFCRAEGGVMVPPFDDPRIIRGQASVAREILGQLPPDETPHLMVLPVGGGGLAAGVTHYFSQAGVATRFRFAEPEGAQSLKESLKTGRRVKLNSIDTFVDGAAVAQIGSHPFKLLKGFSPDDVIAVPTGGLCATMIEMLNVEGIVLEPAGALAIDALNRMPAQEVRGKTIVCIVSGGNFDFERLPEAKERALKFSGLKKYFILQMPQRPGALKDFLLMLGPEDDIARFEYLKKSARNFGSVLIGIETTRPANFERLKKRLGDSGLRFQDITDNELVGDLVV